VPIGGINQWITIRGQNRDNPVVLFLHGGPGTPTNLLDFPFAKAWTSSFTLVQWDQRGAGKTFGNGGTSAADMTINRMTQDGIELAQYLRGHLEKNKIFIVGALTTQRIWAQAYEHADTYEAAGQASSLYAPGYSIGDLYHAIQSIRFTLDTFVGPTMSGPLMSVNLKALGPDFAIPMFVFEGPDDYITSPVLAKAYLDTISAPQKDFVVLPAGGHFAVFTHPEAFVAEMNSRVRPLAMAPAT
jgi:pimeloyl-ACP methyl ester carboxylesterase